MLKDYDKLSADISDIKIKSNFHTHNYLCGHAGGTVYDFCEVAVAHGMSTLGISDHCALPLGFPHNEDFCLESFLSEYLPQFDEAEAEFGDKLKILKGVEIEYFDGCDDYYRRLLESLDYLVLGQHLYLESGSCKSSYSDYTTERDVLAYFDCVKRGLNSGYFSLLAHPDVIFYHAPQPSKKVVAAFDAVVKSAVKRDIPLELNANGVRYHEFRYPTDLLVELCKKHDAKVVISSDAHSPNSLCDEHMYNMRAYAHAVGLNVVDEIKHK